jgi:hypothetical protein
MSRLISVSCVGASVTLCACLVGCELAGPAWEPIDNLETGELALVEGTPDATGVLSLVNDPATTFEILDVDVRLDSRAVESIVRHRAGHDGIYWTEDDNPFDSLQELDSLYFVGPMAIELLTYWAQARGFVPEGDELLGSFEGVEFSVDEADLTLDLVNTATFERLDETVGVDVRATEAIVAARPLESLAQLAELYWVGPAHVELLKSYALSATD